MPPAPEEKPRLPKTSVLLTPFNCEDALRRSLEALERAEGREGLEVIVVDNGSRDGTPRMESDFPGVTFLKLPRHFGLAKARNIGARTATGEYVLLLDPHVEVEPQAVRLLIEALYAAPQAGAATAVLDPPQPSRALPAPADLYRLWREGAPPAPQPEGSEPEWIAALCLLVRKEFLRGMNYFDERLANHWGDLELCWQLRHAGKKILVADGARAAYRAESEDLPAEVRAAQSADMALAAAAYAAKHYGGGAGLGFRLKAMLAATGSAAGALLRAREVRFHTARWMNLLTGQRIDGSQSSP